MDNFTASRAPFIVLHGDVLIKKVSDGRTCLEWVMDMGYSKEQWEHAIRGYVMENRVQFYTGRNYGCVQLVNGEILKALKQYHGSIYGYLPTQFYNGVKVGEAGAVWQPVSELGGVERSTPSKH